jgi:hypothetical protein
MERLAKYLTQFIVIGGAALVIAQLVIAMGDTTS